jgi:hypothetical protein
MEQDRRNSRNSGHKLDTPMSPGHQAGRNISILSALNMDNRNTDRLVFEPSIFGSNWGRTTTNCAVWNVDGEGGVPALSSGNHGHSHVTPPSPFNGKKEDFCGFR